MKVKCKVKDGKKVLKIKGKLPEAKKKFFDIDSEDRKDQQK